MQPVTLTLGEFNDEVIGLAITNNASAFNLTGFGLTAYLKLHAGDLDSAGTTKSYSIGTGIAIVSNPGGTANWTIPRADLQALTFTFWRVDVTIGGLQNTAMYGAVTVTAL
jgi:hypothetical protein